MRRRTPSEAILEYLKLCSELETALTTERLMQDKIDFHFQGEQAGETNINGIFFYGNKQTQEEKPTYELLVSGCHIIAHKSLAEFSDKSFCKNIKKIAEPHSFRRKYKMEDFDKLFSSEQNSNKLTFQKLLEATQAYLNDPKHRSAYDDLPTAHISIQDNLTFTGRERSDSDSLSELVETHKAKMPPPPPPRTEKPNYWKRVASLSLIASGVVTFIYILDRLLDSTNDTPSFQSQTTSPAKVEITR